MAIIISSKKIENIINKQHVMKNYLCIFSILTFNNAQAINRFAAKQHGFAKHQQTVYHCQ
jgi:hypothetical protein